MSIRQSFRKKTYEQQGKEINKMRLSRGQHKLIFNQMPNDTIIGSKDDMIFYCPIQDYEGKIHGIDTRKLQYLRCQADSECLKCKEQFRRDAMYEEYVDISLQVQSQTGKWDHSELKHNDYTIVRETFTGQGSGQDVVIICNKIHSDNNDTHVYIADAGSFKKGHESCIKCYPPPDSEMQLYDFITRMTKKFPNKIRNYDFSRFIYTNAFMKSIMRCTIKERGLEHGQFEASPNGMEHQHYGCPKCGDKLKDHDRAILEIPQNHRNKYIYPDNCYKALHKKMQIICRKCNRSFSQLYLNHLRGQGCPFCKNKNEEICRSIFESIFNIQFSKKITKLLGSSGKRYRELDGYCRLSDNSRLAFEYNGVQHYDENAYFNIVQQDPNAFKKQKERDELVAAYCIRNGITLIVIPYEADTQEKKIDHILKELKEKYKSFDTMAILKTKEEILQKINSNS
jgi:hypothetical protein